MKLKVTYYKILSVKSYIVELKSPYETPLSAGFASNIYVMHCKKICRKKLSRKTIRKLFNEKLLRQEVWGWNYVSVVRTVFSYTIDI